PSDLSLQRVLLSTGGVGYFEYAAVVDGDAELVLDVRLDQVDDVLKSIVVFDDVGGVGSILLPGREPLAQVFRDLPFDAQAVTSPVRLLEALRGARVTVAGSRDLSGRIIGIEAEVMAFPDHGGTVTWHRVGVLSDRGVQDFILEDADAVSFADPALQAQIETALAAIAEHRIQNRRRLTIEARGVGRRTVRVGYVVGAPLWKATYRLTLTPGHEEGHLQGWAVVENMSGQDWHDVELSLVSGNPVTFRQALYTSYYVPRPEVPVEVLGRVLPLLDSGAVALKNEFAGRRSDEMRASGAIVALSEESMQGSAMANEPAAAAPLRSAPAALATMRDDAATQVVFRIAEPVSVASGQSLLVPTPTTPCRRRRWRSISRRPTSATRSPRSNSPTDTASGLPPGVLTLYEQAAGGVTYVGDARLSSLPAGDHRLLSFALDRKILIDRETDSERVVASGTIAQGVLRLTVVRRETTIYRLKSSDDAERRVLIDHPRRQGWKLVTPALDDVEATEAALRLPTRIAGGATRTFAVTVERPVVERFALVDLNLGRLQAFAASRELDQGLRRAFEKLANLRRSVDVARGQIQALENQRAGIHADQDRLRDNLARVPADSDLHRRYLAKMTDQEDALDRWEIAMVAARDRVEAAEQALAQAIHDLKI
ncbi:MAG: DUF4139 domain-containing protein, partial [Alphaproteobacteria bacterium]